MFGSPQGNLVQEANKNRQHPDMGQALMVAWLVRDNPGISKKEILRRLWRPRPGQWDGIREVLRTGMIYQQFGLSNKDRGWYPTDQLASTISRLEAHLGIHFRETG